MFYESKHPLDADYFQIERGQDFSFSPHIHHCFEIINVTEGKMTVAVGGESRELVKNEAVLIFPNQVHSLKTEEKSRHTLCVFSDKLVNSFSKQKAGLIPENNFFVIPDYLSDMFDNLDIKSNLSTVKGTLYSLCGVFDNNAVYVKRDDTKSEQMIIRIFEYVTENYRENCNLKRLSEYLRYDYAYFSRIFRKNTGMNFNAFINQYRISEACYLLKTGNKTVLQIAEECGYDSLRSFNRNFKEYTGISPAEYRKLPR